MDFTLPTQTEDLGRNVDRWARERYDALGTVACFDRGAWDDLVGFGLVGIEASGGTVLDAARGFMGAARAGLVIPLLEADLAATAGGARVLDAIGSGTVVTSIAPLSDPSLVGWGAVADLVVDQRDGRVLSDKPLPEASNAGRFPHGWYRQGEGSRSPRVADPLAARRWVLASALSYGALSSALDLATEHVQGRNQFGRPLAAFQAVQFRLADCLNLLEGIRLSVLDSAWRLATGRPAADKAAALCWLMTEDASKTVAAHCHQVFGALGFCTETGLIQLTDGVRWLRLSVGRSSAVDAVCTGRAVNKTDPPSSVLAGYGPASVSALGSRVGDGA